MNYNTFSNETEELFNTIVERLHPFEFTSQLYPDSKGEYWAICPFHDDRQIGSFSFNANTFHCFSCNASGSIVELGQKLGINGYSKTIRKPFNGITLQEYSEAKKLPQDFLQSFQVIERNQNGIPQVHMPYFDKDGKKVGNRIRTSLNGINRFIWSKGSRPTLYGLLWMDKPLQCCTENQDRGDYVILVEGESDAQTLWLYGYPALGVPGATMWKTEWKEYLEEKEVFIWQEPDNGGAQFVQRIAQDIPDIKVIYPPQDRKDISSCHSSGDNVPDLLSALINSAIPYSQITDELHNMELLEITERATPLFQKDILAEVGSQCEKFGVVGEENNIKILFLALTSRILDNPVSIAIKGTSSSGKSFILKNVLKLFPQTAYYDTSSMSDKALFYSKESFVHRFLIFHEVSGLSSSYSDYLIRILLSDGKIKHSTVENTNKGNQGRDLEKEGPTGFITTTTKITLNPENETRYLSIEISDDPEQTKRILLSIADDFMGDNEKQVVDETFIAFQLWLERCSNRKVVIPYAGVLAEMVKPDNVRTRRDFRLFLNLTMTHTIIYQHQRDQDANGRIVSTLDDYQIIHNLVADVINEGTESSIRPIVRETVKAVSDLLLSENNSDYGSIIESSGETIKYVDLSALSKKLGLDKSPTSRRVQQAIKGGFLENLESRRGYRAKIVLGQPLPEDFTIFPTPEELDKKWLGTVNSSAILQHHLIDTGDSYD